jgi:MFS family permease
VFPSTRALITRFAEGPERDRAVAVWGGAGAAGLVVGVLLGGVLTQVGWEAVFFVNVPLAGAALHLAFALIQPIRDPGRSAASTCRVRRRHAERQPPGVRAGAGPGDGWGSPGILAAGGAGVYERARPPLAREGASAEAVGHRSRSAAAMREDRAQ